MCDLSYRHHFLRRPPQRYAVMLTPQQAERRGQKYHERAGIITDTMIRSHLAGEMTLAAPAAIDGQAHLLPLDIDAGGLPVLQALLIEATRRGLWAFGQYCPRPGWGDSEQRGYVWLSFDTCAPAERLQLLGNDLIRAVGRGMVEARAHAAVTRLPFGQHTHTQSFGQLLLPHTEPISIDSNPQAAYTALSTAFRRNPASLLPAPPLPAQRAAQERRVPPERAGLSIEDYNRQTDLVALLEQYGARPARSSRRIMHCCGHPDERRASLLLWINQQDSLSCKCLSQHHGCPLSGRMHDAFAVYCAMEKLTPAEALRRLNRKEAV